MINDIKPLRMAMVGAGAIAELGHLPALSHTRQIELTAVIDKDLDRARRVAEMFGASHASGDIRGLREHADFACVAVPHHLHEAISIAVLEEGLHVLIEKPLATTLKGCDEIIKAAVTSRRCLGVAMPRRYVPAARFAKAALDVALLGPLRSFRIESGSSEAWPARSEYLLDPLKSGGGVLMANGCHDLDFVRWMLGACELVDCRMDSRNRLEGDCSLILELACGARGKVELSRTRDLRNEMIVEGEKGILTLSLMANDVSIDIGGQRMRGAALSSAAATETSYSFHQVMAAQLDEFAAAVRENRPPEVNGAAGRETIALVEKCYAQALPLEQVWRRAIDLGE